MKQFSNEFLSTFSSIPNSCVFAVISDSNRTCSVLHSNALQSRLGTILEAHDDSCRLLVLDVLDDLEHKLLLCERWKYELAVCGYEILNKRSYINYKVSIQYSKRFHNTLVVLYNKRRDKKIVGVFDNINQAKEFVDQYYKQEIIFPVLANNTLTRTYMKKMYNKNSRV